MGQRDSVGAVAISIPLIVCMAGIMAAQSVEVRRGYAPAPTDLEGEALIASDTDARIDAFLEAILASDSPRRFSRNGPEWVPSFQ